MNFNTALLHGGTHGDASTGATLTPIFQSSAFGQKSAEQIEKIFHNQAPGFAYSRISNPTVAAFDFINHLKYAVNITNIGDTKTLVIHPASTIYAHSTKAEQEKAGVYDDLIRVSVGIEDIEDLLEDFGEALKYVNDNHGYRSDEA